MNKNLNYKLKHFFQCTPFEISTWGLGITGLATAIFLLLQNNIGEDKILQKLSFSIRAILVIIAIILWLLVIVRAFYRKKDMLNEFQGTGSATIIPTFFMTLCNIGCFIVSCSSFQENVLLNKDNKFCLYFGSVLMYISFYMHCIWYIYISWLFFIKKKINPLKDSLASWGVPFVGIGVFCVCCGDIINITLPWITVQAVWWFAFLNFIIFYPCIIYRHIKNPIKSEQLFSGAIFGAPPCLLLAGFLVVFCSNKVIHKTISIYGINFINVFVILLLIFLFALAPFLLIWLWYSLTKQKANFGIVAFTFPIAINCVALASFNKLCIWSDHNQDYNLLFSNMSYVINIFNIIWVIIAIIVYIFIGYKFISYFIYDYKRKKPLPEEVATINF